MHIKENLINFLYDKNYFITIYDNYIHVFNYIELKSITEEMVILKLEKFDLVIKGSDLFIRKMLKNEILIYGVVRNVGINYV